MDSQSENFVTTFLHMVAVVGVSMKSEAPQGMSRMMPVDRSSVVFDQVRNHPQQANWGNSVGKGYVRHVQMMEVGNGTDDSGWTRLNEQEMVLV